MLESLQTSTMVTGYGLLGSPITTSTAGIKLEKDKEGNIEALGIKVVPTILGATAASATTGISFGQDTSYQRMIADINNAQAYVESLDDEKLAELSAMLDEKEIEFDLDDNIILERTSDEQIQYIKK